MKHSCFTRVFRFLVFLLIPLGLLSIGVFTFAIPKITAEIFGPAADSLNAIEKIYWATIVLTHKENLTSPNKSFGDNIAFQLNVGESALSIGKRLGELGLIDDPDVFRSYLIYRGLDTRIQAGDYLLNPMMTPIQIAWEIQDATPEFINFTILAGWRSEEIALALPYSGLEIPPERFLEVVRGNSYEGYLFPGTYTFPRGISAEQLANSLIDAFSENLTNDMEAGYRKQGLTIQEAVILASILEREAVVEDEMPLMASVFLNRLNTGMLLNADPTVQFALGYNIPQKTWWTNPLSSADLAVKSAYNTYLYPGLPPGPICNPSGKALKAVAFPAQTPYFYFRVSCDGSSRHTFSKTLAEHINNTCP